MKKLTLFAGLAMIGSLANAEVITLDIKDAADFKGTEVAEVKPEGNNNGSARKYQPLQSLTLGDFDFSFTKGSGTTEPAYYFANSWNEKSIPSLRVYKNNTMTISAPSDMPMGKVVGTDKDKKTHVIYSGETKGEVSYTNGTGANIQFVSFEITVNEAGSDTPVNPGGELGDSAENPYSVDQALKYIEDGGSEDAIKYVIGYISAIEEVSTQYGNATFTLKGNVSDEEGLSVFRAKYIGGEKFTSTDQIKVGMKVIVNGKLMLYKAKNLKQLAYGELVSLDASGVENVMMDANDAPVYFNLQGARVDEPANGIFIEVKGGKANKVVR